MNHVRAASFEEEAEKFATWRRKIKRKFFLRGFLSGAVPAIISGIAVSLYVSDPVPQEKMTEKSVLPAHQADKAQCEIYLTPYKGQQYTPEIVCNIKGFFRISLIDEDRLRSVAVSLHAGRPQKLRPPVGLSTRFLIYYALQPDMIEMLDENHLSIVRF